MKNIIKTLLLSVIVSACTTQAETESSKSETIKIESKGIAIKLSEINNSSFNEQKLSNNVLEASNFIIEKILNY